MIAAYQSGMTAREAGRLSGCSQDACLESLKRHGISRRRAGEQPTYTVNHSFFSNIDTEEKAYVLGFVSADGWVSDKRHLLGIALSSRDRSHLEKINNAMNSTYPIHFQDTGRITKRENRPITLSKISILSRQIVSDLASLGVVERKSLIIAPPTFLSREMERHYWRGMVDGDGSIHVMKSSYGKKNPLWSICLVSGSPHMLPRFAEFVQREIQHTVRVKQKRARLYSASLVGLELPQRLVRLLYENSTIFLDRKKALADELLSIPITKPNLIGRVLTLNGVSKRAFEWASELGIQRQTINNRLRNGCSDEEALAPIGISAWKPRIFLTLNGINRSVSEWSAITGLSKSAIRIRHQKGWTDEDALTKPKRDW
ncbi:MAG: hypothetical protein ACHP7J_00105 [Terriglobales bacterium]